MTDAHERIWVEDERPLGGGVYVWNARNNPSEEAKQYAVEYIRADLVAVLKAENQRLREALAWYGEQARLARLIHSEGDAGRRNLEADGGTRARAALRSTEASHD